MYPTAQENTLIYLNCSYPAKDFSSHRCLYSTNKQNIHLSNYPSNKMSIQLLIDVSNYPHKTTQDNTSIHLKLHIDLMKDKTTRISTHYTIHSMDRAIK